MWQTFTQTHVYTWKGYVFFPLTLNDKITTEFIYLIMPKMLNTTNIQKVFVKWKGKHW